MARASWGEPLKTESKAQQQSCNVVVKEYYIMHGLSWQNMEFIDAVHMQAKQVTGSQNSVRL